MNRHLDRADQLGLAGQADTMVGWAQDAVGLVRRLHAQQPDLYDDFGRYPAKHLSLLRRDGTLELYDGVLRVTDEDGHVLEDGVSDQACGELLEEDVRPWTYMKFPYLRRLGPDAGWYRVGPLARLLNCDRIATPRAEASGSACASMPMPNAPAAGWGCWPATGRAWSRCCTRPRWCASCCMTMPCWVVRCKARRSRRAGVRAKVWA